MITPPAQPVSFSESERLRALRKLVEKGDAESMSLLVRALDDSSWHVRQEAVQGLIRHGDAKAIGQVLRAMRQDHRNFKVLNAAIQILSQTGHDTLGVLITFLSDPEPDLRLCTALTLGAQNDNRAIPALLHALNDPDANVRYHAIEALGKLRAYEAVDVLVTIAESHDFALAFPALDALAAIGDTRIANRLIPLLEDELLQSATLEALGQLGGEEAIAPLAALLNTCPSLAGTVARALAGIYERHERSYHRGNHIAGVACQTITAPGIQNLIDALDTADGPDLQAIGLVLGWPESEGLERALTQLLGRPGVREHVMETLVRKGRRATELLIGQLRSEDLETRQAAVLALGRIGDPVALPALLEILRTDTQLVAAIAGALAMIGDRRAYGPLLEFLGHDDVANRRAVISALNSLGHPDMAADMARLLRSPNPLIRESAARIVGYAGYAENTDLLLECCRDEHEIVRRAAIESLPSLEPAAVLTALGRALHDKAGGVRAAAARALGQVEAAEAWPLLQEALRDADPWVRYFAIRAAGRGRHSQSVNALIRLAEEDEAMQVRAAAVETLGSLGDATVLPVLSALAKSSNADLARAAAAAITMLEHSNPSRPGHGQKDPEGEAPTPTSGRRAHQALEGNP